MIKDKRNESPFDRNLRRRRILFGNTFLVFLGYLLTQVASFIGKQLGLTTVTYEQIITCSSFVFLVTIIFLIIIRLKNKITITFANIVFYGQFVIWGIAYIYWIYTLNEMRIAGLFFALMALSHLLSYSKLYQSLSITIGATVIQLSVTYYAITFGGQSGELTREVFYTFCFFPSALFISYLSYVFDKQKGQIKKGKRKFEEQANELEAAMEELESMNDALLLTNKELERAHRIAEKDMQMATMVQKGLLYSEPPESDEWDIAFEYKPMSGVSGDFYDFYVYDNNLIGFGLFDVSGHGIASGLITVIARSLIFRKFMKGKSDKLGDVMDRINQGLINEIGSIDNYLTGILLRLTEDSVDYVNAGHPDILIKRSNSSSVEIFDQYTNKGTFLGFEEMKRHYNSLSLSISGGDAILLYSDCLNEGKNSKKVEYGVDRIINAFNNAPSTTAQGALDYIVKDYYAFLGHDNLEDDLTILIAIKK